MKNKLLGIAIGLFLFSGGTLLAQEKTDLSFDEMISMSLEDMLQLKVSVSSTIPLDIFNTPSTVTVIDREMIDNYNFLSVAEALSSIAGVEIYQTIIDKNVPTIRGILQNFYATKTLLLINNVPTWQTIYGEGYIDRLDIHDIEKIEVLKGPASVLYGSNAYNGVINLVLRDEKNSMVNGYMRVGYPSVGATGINLNYKKNDFSVSVFANTSYEKPKEYELESKAGQTYNDDSIYMYFQYKIDKNLTVVTKYKNHSLLLNGFDQSHTYMGSDPSYLSGAGNLLEHKSYLANYSYESSIGDRSNLNLNATYDFYERLHPFAYDRDITIWMACDRARIAANYNYKINEYLKAEMGADHELRHSRGHDTRGRIRDTLRWHNLENDENITESSIFGQLNLSTVFFQLHVGTRYTYNSLYHSNLSSRISALLNINNQNSLKLIWGQSFRAPTMFELYFSYYPYVASNPKLLPEYATSYEMAYLTGYKNLFIQILVFYAQYKDLIYRITPEDGPPQTYHNSTNFDGYGSELELRYKNPNIIDLFLNYNYLAGIGDAEEINYKFVPDHTLSFGVHKSLRQFYISSNLNYVSKVAGHLDDIDPYLVLNVNTGFNHKMKNIIIEHKLSLKNLTGNQMLTPEYIRLTDNINSIPMSSPTLKIIYSLNFRF